MIEIIVSIAIISLLIGVFLVNYRGTDRRNNLSLSAQDLVSSIRLAQNNTLGSVEYAGSVPDGGWGVHFDLSSSTKAFYIFADMNANMEMETGGSMEIFDRIELPQGVSFASTTIGNQADVTFLPPDPITNIWDGSSTSTYIRIQLNDQEGNRKVVLVNLFGLIEVAE